MQPITLTSSIELYTFETGPVATNCYLMIDVSTKSAVLIDAPMGAAEWCLDILHKTSAILSGIWLTHSHWDHMADCEELKQATRTKIYIHQYDAYRLAEPNSYTGFALPITFEPTTADEYFTDGQRLQFGECGFTVIFTPGHTEGGVCFYEPLLDICFVGDTLFFESIGRTDLHGGDMQTLLVSIQLRLMSLPDSVVCFPGHMQATTIGHERVHNPFLMV